MALDITIETIPNEKQRYSTVGDYITIKGGSPRTKFYISDMQNKDYEFLVAIHELIEQHLTEKRGITQVEIDEFDMNFEAQRKPGNTDEPGNDPKAPYYNEHQFATKVERMLAVELGVDWNIYDKTVNEL